MSNKSIAIVNQKGGVGKTTTATNLAAGLVNDGYSVLVIDADPQNSLTTALGIEADTLDDTLAKVMEAVIDDQELSPDYGIIHHAEGIDVMPANIELSGTETLLVNTMSREFVLKTYVDSMRPYYDYILIDCMPSLGMMTVNALVAADSIIIPSQPNYLSTKGLDLLFKTISKIKKTINPKLQIDGILLTMVDFRTNNAKDITEFVRTNLGQKINVFNTEIPNSVKAAECSLEGKSIFEHDKTGKVAAAYEALTKEVEEIECKEKIRSKHDWIR